jgi:hypothetical protein
MWSTGNIRMTGSLNPIVTTWRLCAMDLPVRRKNGTPFPSCVLDVGAQGHERFSLGVRRDTRFTAVTIVLTANHVGRVERRGGIEDLADLVAKRLGVERNRLFHRDEGEDLEEVRDDHVAKRSRLFEERTASLDRDRLRHVDLDVTHVVTVPDRLVESVREPQGEDVVDRLLSEEVVDSKDVGLVEALGDRGVEAARRREIGAEGLFTDDLRVLVEPGLPQHLDDAQERTGRNGQMEESLHVPADLLFGPRHRVNEFAGAVLFGVGEGEVLLELLPVRAFGLVGAELADRVVRALSKVLVGHGRRLT